jgi:isocitrate dehydrogenase (NAD+)
MLRHLDETEAADRIMAGVSAVLHDGRVLTTDLGGEARTSEMAAAIIAKMQAGAHEAPA